MSYWLREMIVPPNHAPLTCATYETFTLLYTLPGLGSKLRTRKVKPWTAEEARQFLESAKRDQDPLCAAYVPILVMGLRKGEVVGLPRSAVNLDRTESDIGWQLQRVRGQLLHRETKTEASEATLPMPGICVTALRSARRTRPPRRLLQAPPVFQVGLVFTTRAGTPFEPRNLNRRFETRCAKTGVRRITVRHEAYLCHSAVRARRASSGCHADPAACADRRDDERLYRGL
jgi:integrase